MKYCYAALLFTLTLFAACSKEDETVTPPPAATKMNTWKLGTTTYTVNNYAKSGETFQTYDLAGNGVFFSFAAFPTQDGNYRVVSDTATLGANDVSIVAFGSSSGTSYFSSGHDNTAATVKVISATRLRITLPDTWVVKGGTDSLKLSASLGDL